MLANVSRNNNKAKRTRRRSRSGGLQSQRRVGSARHPHFGPFRTVVGSGLLRSRYLDCSARPFAKMTEIVQSNPLGIIEPNRHDIWMAADVDGLHLSDKQWSRNRKWVPRCLIGTTALSRYKQISKE